MPKFKRKTINEIQIALGDISNQSKSNQKLLNIKFSKTMKRIPKPNEGDWLSERKEKGQSFRSFKRSYMHCKPHGTFKTIYIQPIGSFKGNKRIIPLKILKEFVECFFYGLDCEVLKTYTLEEANEVVDMTSRTICDGKITQLKTGSVLSFLEKTKKLSSNKKTTKKTKTKKKKKDRYRSELCSIAVTYPYDLYPSEDYNFVFGIARIMDGVGVYSFSRMDPNFPNLKMQESESPSKEEYQLILRRCLKTLVHELGHLFGLKHCIYFDCLMKGSNHREESDAAPMFLCPCCLHKIVDSLNCDLLKRYKRLHSFFKKYEMIKEYEWVEARVEEVFGVQKKKVFVDLNKIMF